MKALTKNDYKVLTCLFKEGAMSRVKSATVKQLKEGVDTSSDKVISETKVRDALKILMEYDFVALGIADGRTKTYFITQEGLNELTSLSSIKK